MTWRAAPVLVTAATGNIGREVVRCLGEHGTPLVAAVTDPDRARKVLGASTPLVRLDLRDPGTYEAALRGVPETARKHRHTGGEVMIDRKAEGGHA